MRTKTQGALHQYIQFLSEQNKSTEDCVSAMPTANYTARDLLQHEGAGQQGVTEIAAHAKHTRD